MASWALGSCWKSANVYCFMVKYRRSNLAESDRAISKQIGDIFRGYSHLKTQHFPDSGIRCVLPRILPVGFGTHTAFIQVAETISTIPFQIERFTMQIPDAFPQGKNECPLTDVIHTLSLIRVEAESAGEPPTYHDDLKDQSQTLHNGKAKPDAEEARLKLNVKQSLNDGRLTPSDELLKQVQEKRLLRDAEKDKLIGELKQYMLDIVRDLKLYLQQSQGEMTQGYVDLMLLYTYQTYLLIDIAKMSSCGDVGVMGFESATH